MRSKCLYSMYPNRQKLWTNFQHGCEKEFSARSWRTYCKAIALYGCEKACCRSFKKLQVSKTWDSTYFLAHVKALKMIYFTLPRWSKKSFIQQSFDEEMEFPANFQMQSNVEHKGSFSHLLKSESHYWFCALTNSFLTRSSFYNFQRCSMRITTPRWILHCVLV